MTVTVTAGTEVTSTFGAYRYAIFLALPYAAGGSVSASVRAGAFPWWTYQITGTLGSGGSIQMEGSNDGGTTWNIIGTAVSSLSGAGALVHGSSVTADLIRFSVTAGDGTTALNVYMTLAGNRG